MFKLAAALLVSPALATALMLLIFVENNLIEGNIRGALGMSVLISLIAYPFILVIGIPLCIFLYKKRLFSLITCIASSLTCALSAFVFILFPMNARERIQELYEAGPFIFSVAITAGVLFWLIGVKNNQTLNNSTKP